MPAWRSLLTDASLYAKRSLTNQYQEIDRRFVQRLLVDEGIFRCFEHSRDPDTFRLHMHTQKASKRGA